MISHRMNFQNSIMDINQQLHVLKYLAHWSLQTQPKLKRNLKKSQIQLWSGKNPLTAFTIRDTLTKFRAVLDTVKKAALSTGFN